MRVLIVHAHHEPASFSGAMTREAVEALTEKGHEVVVSDLYAMGFDPVSDRRNFRTVADPALLNQQAEESLASAKGGFVPELKVEMDKLVWCEALILQFPIWWLDLPAILKGWIDRVFAVGVAYGGGQWFEQGRLAGRRAMCSVTVGGLEPVYSEFGIYGPIEQILHPIHRGILGFTGFTVVEPFIVYGPSRIDDQDRRDYLVRYRLRILGLEAAATIPMPDSRDYEGFVRKSRSM